MEDVRICRKCDMYLNMSEGVIEYAKRYIERLSDEDKVSDEVYEKRLMICDKCDMLCADVCRKCGCYVEIRAAIEGKQCPDEKW